MSFTDKASPLKIYLLAAVVGGLTGLLGAAFHFGMDRIFAWHVRLLRDPVDLPVPPWLLAPVLGAVMVFLSVWLVRRFAPEACGSGVQEIEGALQEKRPVRWRRVLPVKFSAGLLSLGSGLVMGREGPTIQIGGALGKMVGEITGVTREDAHILLAAGAGAGLAAAFNAPLAGILFVTEEMRRHFNYTFVSFHSVLLACFMSVAVCDWFLGQGPFLSITVYAKPALATLPLFLVLGTLIGGFGVLFNRLLVDALDAVARCSRRFAGPTSICIGAGVGFLVWAFPPIVGGGSELITELLAPGAVETGWKTLAVLLVARTAITAISYGSGAPGGIFAPMLALGALSGLLFGHLAQALVPELAPEPGAFAIAAMGALFAASVRAPLTGIVVVFELTGNPDMILPMIATCITASVVAQTLGGHPIYQVLLDRTLRLASPAEGRAGGRPPPAASAD